MTPSADHEHSAEIRPPVYPMEYYTLGGLISGEFRQALLHQDSETREVVAGQIEDVYSNLTLSWASVPHPRSLVHGEDRWRNAAQSGMWNANTRMGIHSGDSSIQRIALAGLREPDMWRGYERRTPDGGYKTVPGLRDYARNVVLNPERFFDAEGNWLPEAPPQMTVARRLGGMLEKAGDWMFDMEIKLGDFITEPHMPKFGKRAGRAAMTALGIRRPKN
jgi:hypothetical protein